MPENEFEKKVFSELSGLRVKPSEEVWTKVEERIRKKKNRRVFVVIFLLAGLALLGYWQRNLFFGGNKNEIVNAEKPVDSKSNVEADKTKEIVTKNKTELEINEENNKKKGNKTTEELQNVNDNNVKIDKIKNADKSNNTNTDKLKTEPKSANKNNNVELNPRPVNKESSSIDPELVKSKKARPAPKNSSKEPPVNTDPGIQTKIPDQSKQKDVVVNDAGVSLLQDKEKTSLKDSNEIKEIKQEAVKEVSKQDEIKAVETKIDSVKVDTASKKPEIKKQDSLLKTGPAIDSPVVNLPNKKINKKWQLGIEFNPGISALSNEIFSLSSMKSADLNSIPSTGAGVPPPPIADPSPRKAGLAFQIGGFAKKQFTQRSSVSIGLRYAYYSDNVKIGTTRLNFPSSYQQFFDQNSIARFYGAIGDTVNYTSRYHFIELPVYYNVRLNKKADHPLTLQLGLKFGRLVGSNALVYDTLVRGIYYKSDKYLNKTQFGFSASLNWTIVNKQKIQWTIGPVLDLHFNSLMNSPFEKKKYLFFAGIRSAINFNSKK